MSWEFVANLRGPQGLVGDWSKPALTVADRLDAMFTPGKYPIQSATVAAAVGSPISPYGDVEISGVGASAIQEVKGTDLDPRVFVRGTTAGGAAWGGWRRTDKDTKTVLHQLSNPSNGALNEVAPSRHVRVPLKIAAQADAFRLYFRNYNDRESKNYAGDITFAGVFFGKRAKDANGVYTEDFAETPISLGLPSRTTMPDGSYRWAVSTNYTKLEANVEYLISYGYTTAAGQENHVGYGGAYLGTVPGVADYVDASGMTWSPTAPLDTYLTLLVAENTPHYGYLGSSTPAGANTNYPLRDSFAWRHAYASGAIPTVLAHAGSAMTSWASTSAWKWQKARAFSRMQRLHFALGSNDVNGSATLEELQDLNNTVAAAVRSQVADQLVYLNIAPRANEDPAIQAKRLAYNGWLDGLPNGALATYDVASVVAGADGSLAGIYDSGDGVHLNALGQAKTAEAIIKAGGAQGTPGTPGDGVPAGGAALQLLRKNSTGTTTEWATPTKTLVGLSNVDNTSDAEKPLSALAIQALSGKVAKGDLVINARDYGVTGDGVTDDSAALLAAANAAVALGYPLVIPTGFTMSISSPGIAFPAGLTMNTNGAKFKTPAQTTRVPVIQVKSNTTITGGLYVTTLGGLNGSGVTIGGATNVRIDVVDVQSTIPGQGFGNVRDNGLNINNSSYITIDTVKIKNFDYPIAAESVPNLSIGWVDIDTYVKGIWLRDNSHFRLTKGGWIRGASPNTAYTPGHNGILIEATALAEDYRINNLAVHDAGEHGFRTSGPAQIRNIWFNNCSAINCTGSGFKLLGSLLGDGVYNENVWLVNCLAEDCGNVNQNTNGFLIQMANYVKIVSPLVRHRNKANAGYAGIRVGGVTHLQITDPDLKNPSQYGIYIDSELANVSDVKINGANIDMAGGWGIYLGNGATAAGNNFNNIEIEATVSIVGTGGGAFYAGKGTYTTEGTWTGLNRVTLRSHDNVAAPISTNTSATALASFFAEITGKKNGTMVFRNGSRWLDTTTGNSLLAKAGAWATL